jgi:hypothetical protein
LQEEKGSAVIRLLRKEKNPMQLPSWTRKARRRAANVTIESHLAAQRVAAGGAVQSFGPRAAMRLIVMASGLKIFDWFGIHVKEQKRYR